MDRRRATRDMEIRSALNRGHPTYGTGTTWKIARVDLVEISSQDHSQQKDCSIIVHHDSCSMTEYFHHSILALR